MSLIQDGGDKKCLLPLILSPTFDAGSDPGQEALACQGLVSLHFSTNSDCDYILSFSLSAS